MPKKAKRSVMMDRLYGKEYAQQVYNRLQELDPEFNEIIQRIPYDKFWSRKGLSGREKCFITPAALVAMGKEEQMKIHMRGFLHSGGKIEDLKHMLIHLAIYCGFPAAMNGFAALKEAS